MGSILSEQVHRLNEVVNANFFFSVENPDSNSSRDAIRYLHSAASSINKLIWSIDYPGVDFVDYLSYPRGLDSAGEELLLQLKLLSYTISMGSIDPFFDRTRDVLTEVTGLIKASVDIVYNLIAIRGAASYPIVHRGKKLSIVGLWQEPDEPPPTLDHISVAMYVDGHGASAREVLARVDALVDALGYGNVIDEQIENGSIFRRYIVTLKRGISSRNA